MKIRSVLLAFIFTGVFFSSVIKSQTVFEGMVKIKAEYEEMVSDMVYFIKNNQIRVESSIPDQDEKGIFIMSGNKSYMLMPGSQMYMEFDLEDNTGGQESEEAAEPVLTGEKMQILGHECEKWIIKEEDGTTEMWVAYDMGGFMMPSGPMSESPDWAKKLEGKNFFPLVVNNLDEEGNNIGKFTVTEIMQQEVSASMFEIPAGYQKMELPKLEDLFK